MKTIENPEAVFDAVVVFWNVLTQRWELSAAGTLEECQRYWDQVRLEGFGGRMQMIRQSVPKFTLPEKEPMQPTYKLNPRLPEGLTDGMVFGGQWNAVFDRSNYANHGEIVNAEHYDRELTPKEIKELANNTR